MFYTVTTFDLSKRHHRDSRSIGTIYKVPPVESGKKFDRFLALKSLEKKTFWSDSVEKGNYFPALIF